MNRGPAQKGRDNVAAIRLAAKLVAEDRPATREEQETLALYIGWGSIKNVFAKDPKQVWEREVQADLKTLLADEEYRQAAESVENAHYTDVATARAVWAGAERLGFDGGRVDRPHARRRARDARRRRRRGCDGVG